MKITKAEFIKGVIGDDYKLRDRLPQVALLGRSNAGKSSVINSLVNRKNLVKTSKVPGKTTEANFFRINDKFYFVDFPGYGYAQRSVKERNKLIKRIFWYIENFETKPKLVLLIIDAKVGLTSLDYEMIDILKENNHRVVIVANKIDKLSKTVAEKQISNIENQAPTMLIFPYSAKTKKGRDELLEKINDFIQI